MESVLVTNTEARINSIAYAGERGTSAVVRLMPGVNAVSKKTWAKASANSIVQDDIKKGVYVVSDDTVNVDEKIGLSKVGEKEARSIVSNCLDHAVLEEWLGIEKRAGIRALIEKQIEKVVMVKKA